MGEKFHLTKKGLTELKEELEKLKKVRALKIKGEVPDILHSEEVNPEYLVFQEDLDFIEGRIAELENIIKNAVLIKPPAKEERDKVFLGATVVVEVDGREDEFKIVGSLEANPSLGKISDQSPVGKALINRRLNETVIISSPVQVTYKIKKIRYDL
jgi:transcription elongation factor GreA